MAYDNSYNTPQPPLENAFNQGAPATAAPYTAPGYAAAPPRQKKRGWIVAIVVCALLAAVVFGISSCTGALLNAGSANTQTSKPGTVGIIYLSGTIQYDGSSCSPEGLKELLDRAEKDDNIAAVVLRVNSGGGTATAGEEMSTYVREFSKPVVVSSASINASAAYEISAQADYIYVARSTETGSIGTAMQTVDYSRLLKLLGIEVVNITSSESKDSSYGTRPLTDEERAYYQELVENVNEVFIDNVALGRNMTVEQVRTLATGKVFTGEQAIELGLVDEVGTLEQATEKAAELAGVSSSDVPTMTLSLHQDELSNLIYLLSSRQDATVSTRDLVDALKELKNNDGIAR